MVLVGSGARRTIASTPKVWGAATSFMCFRAPRGAYTASTYVLHRCGGCRWMPPLERLLNASRAANGVDDASAADALAAVWETRVLFTGKL